MHNRHAWVQKTEEGVRREVRVIKHGGEWRFQSKRSDQQEWIYYREPLPADLEEFRNVLFRKYQRRRAAYEDVVWADGLLAKMRSENRNAF
jgi:hypothetical protein